MKEYGNFKLYTTTKEIREIQTIKEPSNDDVRLFEGNEGFTKGFSAAIYNRMLGKYCMISCRRTEEELIEAIEAYKKCCIKFPEVFGNWYTEISDIYIFESDGYMKPNWGLHGILVEE